MTQTNISKVFRVYSKRLGKTPQRVSTKLTNATQNPIDIKDGVILNGTRLALIPLSSQLSQEIKGLERKFSLDPAVVNKSNDLLAEGIDLHERNQLEESVKKFKLSGDLGNPLGLFFHAMCYRHGWGVEDDGHKSLLLLYQAAHVSILMAVYDQRDRDSFDELALKEHSYQIGLILFELGVSFQKGWGTERSYVNAAYYFKLAAELGDPDAQNELAGLYLKGQGVKRDKYRAAALFRKAADQGRGLVGNTWIYKDKYMNCTEKEKKPRRLSWWNLLLKRVPQDDEHLR
ncbi:HCP-like protein [Rozella allomycis CSF55]|uniref:HCP-like protein n=1 Tax=Rozella allomycis (strain CSF55) TaxID=988480 RepID=A0A4P9YNC4_ROZAC|nr:HCP-like protein [Rozella allomycis CSF55]